MDLGTSLNPAVDIGQLEGGFVMTLGYIFTERCLYDQAPPHYNTLDAKPQEFPRVRPTCRLQNGPPYIQGT
jgi:xanthine dehydrogenase molybdopterin-binding subunit B